MTAEGRVASAVASACDVPGPFSMLPATPPFALNAPSFLPSGSAAVEVVAPGGGGYGPPVERSREAIEADLREGYVTADRLAQDYPGFRPM